MKQEDVSIDEHGLAVGTSSQPTFVPIPVIGLSRWQYVLRMTVFMMVSVWIIVGVVSRYQIAHEKQAVAARSESEGVAASSIAPTIEAGQVSSSPVSDNHPGNEPKSNSISIVFIQNTPLNIFVETPDGDITSDRQHVYERGGFTYTSYDIGKDGVSKDILFSPAAEDGVYTIVVKPTPKTDLEQTYSLSFIVGTTSIVLAHGVPAREAPPQGYSILVKGAEASLYTKNDILGLQDGATTCAEGQEMLDIPSIAGSSNVGTATKMCATKEFGKVFATSSLTATWTSLKEYPIDYHFIQGPYLYTDDFSIVLENQTTKTTHEITSLALAAEDAISDIKEHGGPSQFSLYTHFLSWFAHAGNVELWGISDIHGSADPSPPLYHAVFIIDTRTGDHVTHLMPRGVRVGNDDGAINFATRNVVYGDITDEALIVKVLDLITSKEEVITSYSQSFLRKYYQGREYGFGTCLDWGDNYIVLCPPVEMDARWLDNRTVTYTDLQTKQQETYTIKLGGV